MIGKWLGGLLQQRTTLATPKDGFVEASFVVIHSDIKTKVQGIAIGTDQHSTLVFCIANFMLDREVSQSPFQLAPGKRNNLFQ